MVNYNYFCQERKVIMRIETITENKKQFLDLLLLADEQESMIDRYLGSRRHVCACMTKISKASVS